MNIQLKQHRELNLLLKNTGLAAQKETLVKTFTNGRSSSRKDLTYQEAGELISYLKSADSSHKMRRKIIKLAHEMGWKQPGTNLIDMDRVNGWCKTYGFGKKGLNEYTLQELPKLVSIFEEKVYKPFLKAL